VFNKSRALQRPLPFAQAFGFFVDLADVFFWGNPQVRRVVKWLHGQTVPPACDY